VRARAARLGLRTATKPDSQDVCFITSTGGREDFLARRIPLHPGRLLDTNGDAAGTVDAVELVTVGQRRGLGGGAGDRRYAVAVDVPSRTVTVGTAADLLTDTIPLTQLSWIDEAPKPGARVLVQCSAHGEPADGVFTGGSVRLRQPRRRVAPGQSVVLYHGDDVLGGGIAAR